MASKNNPENTINVANHCLGSKLLPNNNTDAKTVKNFLLVVIMEHGSEPNSTTIKYTKN